MWIPEIGLELELPLREVVVMKFAFVQVTVDVHQYAAGVRQPPPLCPIKYGCLPGVRWIWPKELPNARQRLTSTWSAEDPGAVYDMSLTRPMQFNNGYKFEPVDDDYAMLDDDMDLDNEESEGPDVWD